MIPPLCYSPQTSADVIFLSAPPLAAVPSWKHRILAELLRPRETGNGSTNRKTNVESTNGKNKRTVGI